MALLARGEGSDSTDDYIAQAIMEAQFKIRMSRATNVVNQEENPTKKEDVDNFYTDNPDFLEII